MRLVAFASPGNDVTPCAECSKYFRELTLFGVGLTELALCPTCLIAARRLFRVKRRVLNPRLVLALQALGSRETIVDEDTLRGRIGRYSTNTLKSMCARGFAARIEETKGVVAYQLLERGETMLVGRAIEPPVES
jgi:hypothetical protein